MTNHKILLVDDDRDVLEMLLSISGGQDIRICEPLHRALRRCGYGRKNSQV